MADWEKSDDEADYYHRDMGYGMLRFSNRSYGNKQIFIVNPALKKVYPISEPSRLISPTRNDLFSIFDRIIVYGINNYVLCS